MSDKTWQKFKEKRQRSGISWNLFILSLLNEKKNKNNRNRQ